jgi:hypothetical protein
MLLRGVAMKLRWAFLTIVFALVLGVGATLLFMRPTQTWMRISFSCLLLSEAEKAGYLDNEKRRALLQKLAASTSLDANDRQSVIQLASACPKM